VSPVKYELGFYIPDDVILHSHRRENLKSYILSEDLFSEALTQKIQLTLESKFQKLEKPDHNCTWCKHSCTREHTAL
jgi:hypothetical protein